MTNTRILETILKAQESFITYKHTNEIFSYILDEIINLTQSSIGFIGEVFKENDQPKLKLQAFTKSAFINQSQKEFIEKMPEKVVFESLNNLFGHAILNNTPIITMDPSKDSRAKGIPKGHPFLNSFMGIPISLNDEVIGFVGVANGLIEYTEELVNKLKPLINSIALLLNAKNLQKEKDVFLKQLSQNEEKYRIFLEYSTDFIYLKDEKGKYVIINKNLADFFGKKIEDIIGRSDFELMAKEYATECVNSDLEVIATQSTIIREEVIANNVYEVTKFPVKYHDKIVVGGIIRNVTEHKKAKKMIYDLSFYDHLTHLPNKFLFLDFLNSAVSKAIKNNSFGAILLIDLDHFKSLNESKGHHIGDELLVKLSVKFEELCSQNMKIARIGGDEFVFLIENIDNDFNKIEEIYLNILEKLASPISIDNNQMQYTPSLSVGVSVFGLESTTSETILKQAEIALYKSKENGRNNICFFDPSMQHKIDKEVSLDVIVRNAIKENQFELFYQPQFLYDETLVGFEGLLRLRHEGRIIPPFEVITYAEEFGLINDIGQIVVEIACKQLDLWKENERFKNIPISVNVSAKQLLSQKFIVHLIETCKKYSVLHSMLKIEITESVLIDNIESSISQIKKLKSLGFKISLDDFGTGFSSLSYLKKLQPDELKIDRSFVMDILSDKEDLILVETIIAMAKKLNIRVVAEGIENIKQLEVLNSNECEVYQGYFFAKPLCVEECENLKL